MTFTSGDRVEDVRLENHTYQYLYDDGSFYVFMDIATYEQKQVPHAVFADQVQYLRDNMELDLLDYEGEVIDYDLPKSMEFEVVEAENAVAGDTATGATKEVLTETGLKVTTPLFIKDGDVLKLIQNQAPISHAFNKTNSLAFEICVTKWWRFFM